MIIERYHSIRNARRYLDKLGALNACHTLVEKSKGQLKDNPELLEDLGFKSEITIPVDGLNPRFDAYHKDLGIGVELEKREQMNVRSHLLFTEIAYQKKFIKIAVYILPVRTKSQGKKANFGRTLKELTNTELFSERFFQLEVPIYLLGYK